MIKTIQGKVKKQKQKNKNKNKKHPEIDPWYNLPVHDPYIGPMENAKKKTT